jgi:hypothetical protein
MKIKAATTHPATMFFAMAAAPWWSIDGDDQGLEAQDY